MFKLRFLLWLFRNIAVFFYHLTFSTISISYIVSFPLITAKRFLFSIKILLIFASCISFLPSQGPFPSAYRTHSKISVQGLLKPNPVFAQKCSLSSLNDTQFHAIKFSYLKCITQSYLVYFSIFGIFFTSKIHHTPIKISTYISSTASTQ